MPGWIIQGVRGEGKSLCAVGKAVEYLKRGCPVATNLDLFLDEILPIDNLTLAYRLPDYPRLVDFELLPPAYDVTYKGEDKNGLLILDELGTWLNSRSWNDKGRLQILNWLFLSRKHHWDIILLAQDFEMIDAQVRTTLCDYLVQASRLDRYRIPYLANILEFLGFSSYMPRLHVYHVFYGMSLQTKPVDVWRFRGRDLYAGYDTNQRFKDGYEPLLGTLVDMRSVYTYLPAAYLTGQIYFSRLSQQAADIQKFFQKNKESRKKDQEMAKPRIVNSHFTKAIFLLVALAVYLIYKIFFSSSPLIPNFSKTSVTSAPVPLKTLIDSNSNQQSFNSFFDSLLNSATPYLSAAIFDEEKGLTGYLKFRDKQTGLLVDTLPISDLHFYNAFITYKGKGAVLNYQNKAYFVKFDSEFNK